MFKKAKNYLAKFSFLKNKKENSTSIDNSDLDKKLVTSLSRTKIPTFRQLKYVGRFLNPTELWIVRLLSLVIAFSLIFLGVQFYRSHLEQVPVIGGDYTEGLVGSPKYINPLYSSASDVDSDISRLIFSSIFKHNGKGELVNDLAEGYQVSDDNLTYIIQIREGVKWHNEDNLTVDDIIFTFNAIKDSNYKSTLRSSFSGVEIEKLDDRSVQFKLEEPYAGFLELLTFGILPEQLWMQIPSEVASLAELNLKPIGSGPYRFKSLVKDKVGNVKSYKLVLNEDYYNDTPYIEEITFKFFINFEELISALNENEVDGIGYLPSYIEDKLVGRDSLNFYNLNLPNLTAIFFNEKNNTALENKTVREALAMAVNKNYIVSDVFQGEVHAIDGPILPSNFAYNKDITKYKFNIEEAKQKLEEAGWETTEITEESVAEAETVLASSEETTEESAEETEDVEVETISQEDATEIVTMGAGNWLQKDGEYLVVNLTTVDNGEMVEVVQAVKNDWETVGLKTNINIVAANQIQSDVIKGRNFEALFYGQVVGSDPDIYVFWHSSQIGESGLNIANYSNKNVDKLLEEARLSSDIEERIQKYKEIQEIITGDLPAIFMYSPLYTYVQSKKIKGFDIKNILIPSDRFNNISQWHIKTGNKIVW